MITSIAVNQDDESHILHYLFSVLVGPCDLECCLFGCCRELPSEGLPAIKEIPMASFEAQRIISAVSQEDHIVHLEGALPFR